MMNLIEFAKQQNELNAKINDFLIKEGIDPFDNEDEYRFMFNLISIMSNKEEKKKLDELLNKFFGVK